MRARTAAKMPGPSDTGLFSVAARMPPDAPCPNCSQWVGACAVIVFRAVLSAPIPGIFGHSRIGNALPLPALDGGRLFLLVLRRIGLPISEKQEGWVHLAGFVALIAFGIIIAISDVTRFF